MLDIAIFAVLILLDVLFLREHEERTRTKQSAWMPRATAKA